MINILVQPDETSCLILQGVLCILRLCAMSLDVSFHSKHLSQAILAHAKVARSLCGYPGWPNTVRLEAADVSQQLCLHPQVCTKCKRPVLFMRQCNRGRPHCIFSPVIASCQLYSQHTCTLMVSCHIQCQYASCPEPNTTKCSEPHLLAQTAASKVWACRSCLCTPSWCAQQPNIENACM